MNPTPHTADAAQALERRAFDLASLVKAGRAMNNILNLDELYAVILAITAEKLACGPVTLLLYDPEEHILKLAKTRSLDAAMPDTLRFVPEEGLLWQNVLQQEPFAVTNSSGKALFEAFFIKCQLAQLQSDLWVPLFLRDRLIGVLTIGRRIDGPAFDALDLEFLKQFASTAAASINTCTLYVRRETERRELQRTFRNLTMLYDIGKAMTLISDLKELLGYILEQAIGIASAEKGSIMLYDATKDALEIRVIEGLEDKQLQATINDGEYACRTFKRGEGVAGQVLESGNPVIVNNVEGSEAFVDSKDSFVQSIACIPMNVYGEIIGVINVTNKQTGAEFSEEEVNLLKAIADQAAVAINKAQLWEMAVTDSMTGLYIRRYMLGRLSDELIRSDRYGHQLSVAMIDIDHFKSVNDTYGHDVGDRVLKRVAGVLKRCARNVDIVGRHGGEEFLLILSETEPAQAAIALERMRASVESGGKDDEPKVTISSGLAGFPADGRSVEDIIRHADVALYQAKNGGRNRVVTYTHDMKMS